MTETTSRTLLPTPPQACRARNAAEPGATDFLKPVLSIALIAGLAIGLVQRAPAADLLAGDEQAVWLIRDNGDQKTFNVYRRELGGDWKPTLRNMTGRPERCCAVGDRLHVIYTRQQRTIFSPAGISEPADAVPGTLLGLCEGLSPNDRPTLLVLVHQSRSAIGRTELLDGDTPPTSQPATAPAPAGYHAIYRSAGTGWKLLAEWPASQADATRPVQMASVGPTVYFRPVGRPASAMRCLRRAAPRPEFAGLDKALGPPAGLVSLGDRLALLEWSRPSADASTTQPTTSRPADDRAALTLRTWVPGKGPVSPAYVLRHNDATLTWTGMERLQIARLARQLALLWVDDGELVFALASPAGAVRPPERLDAKLADLPNPERVAEIYQYFLLGVLVVIVLCMVALQPQRPVRPFALPPQFAPAPLPRRFVAFLIDFVPFNLLAVAVLNKGFGVSMADIQQKVSTPQSIPGEWLLVLLGAQALYVLYCLLAEWRFSRTLGKRLLRLRVVNCDGNPVTLRGAALRNLMKIMELNMIAPDGPFGFLLLIVVVWPLMTRYRQRLGDLFARTAVIDDRVRVAMPVEAASETPS